MSLHYLAKLLLQSRSTFSKLVMMFASVSKTISLLEWETPAFILPDLRLPTIQIWARLTTQSREKYSSGSARRKFVKLTNWSIACYVWRGLEQSVISTL